MQQQQEAQLLALFRAATEAQKKMVLGTLQSSINRNRAANEPEVFVIVGNAKNTR